MATHDYVIANGTGAAVRSDLNNALAAIVSNNSSSSEPATKYAYQWWADTTTGQLKLRNSANNGWVTIFELDGTMLMEDGTLSTPGLAFATDLNTGIYKAGTDIIGFAAGGTESLRLSTSGAVFNEGSNDYDFRVESNGQTHMLFVDAGNDRIGIGTSAPAVTLDIESTNPTIRLTDSDASGTPECQISGGGGDLVLEADRDNEKSDSLIRFAIDGSEKLRLNTSGRLLVGTTTSNAAPLTVNGTVGFGDSQFRAVFGDGYLDADSTNTFGAGNSEVQIQAHQSNRPAFLSLGGPQGTNEGLGAINFFNSGNTDGKRSRVLILGAQEGSNSDQGGMLLFYTAGDGASSPTERMRISSGGSLFINRTTAVAAEKFSVGNDGQVAYFRCTVNANHSNIQMSHSYATGGQTATQISIQNAALTEVGSIKSTASSTSFNTSSDYRLKENVVDIADGITRVKQLSPKRFNFIINADKTVDGFLAHEAQAVVPEAVTGEKDGEEMQGIDQAKLVPLLTAALQEAIAKIETLETKVAALEAG